MGEEFFLHKTIFWTTNITPKITTLRVVLRCQKHLQMQFCGRRYIVYDHFAVSNNQPNKQIQ